jgi:hypothetical protein
LEKRKYRSHTKIEFGKLVPKKSFETEKDAVRVARIINIQSKTIHKMVAYKCETCGKWHIGKNGTELTEKDRLHYKKMLDREKKIGF